MNGDQTLTPRRSRRKASECSSVQSEVAVFASRKRNSASICSLTEQENLEENSNSTEAAVATSSGGTKRKNSESGKTEAMSVADRIKLLSHDQNQKSTPPRTDSVLQLLLQGLNSKDKRILESVLERADEDLITDTVKRLPLEAVLPLLETLHHYIQVRPFFLYKILYFWHLFAILITFFAIYDHFGLTRIIMQGRIYDFNMVGAEC